MPQLLTYCRCPLDALCSTCSTCNKETLPAELAFIAAVLRVAPFESEMVHLLPSGIPKHRVSRRHFNYHASSREDKIKKKGEGAHMSIQTESLKFTKSSFLLAPGWGPSGKHCQSPPQPEAKGPGGWLWTQLWLQTHTEFPTPGVPAGYCCYHTVPQQICRVSLTPKRSKQKHKEGRKLAKVLDA